MLDPKDNDTAFMFAVGVRYCLDRHSYAPSLCCDWLHKHWQTFRRSNAEMILRDIREHVAFVEEPRNNTAVGWEADLQTWQKFLAWAEAAPKFPDERAGEREDGDG